ncbi:MAG: hypothetical protein H6Q17_643 [Bacteroidetes bacterium]|nr:hypothetical protein [Bacteroidota bacterium]
MGNVYCLQSLVIPNIFLRTDGKTVNCQYTRSSWERWQFTKCKNETYIIESTQFLGNFIMLTDSEQIQMTSVQASATPFKFVIADIEQPVKIAILTPKGNYLSITDGMSAFSAPGGGKVEVTAFSEKSIFLIMPVE